MLRDKDFIIIEAFCNVIGHGICTFCQKYQCLLAVLKLSIVPNDGGSWL